jgi:hypothetical protein
VKDGPPAGFGFRYIIWFLFWKNAITVLMITQAAFSAVLALIPNMVNDKAFHWLLITNAVLCAILAQVKRDGSPPKRGKKK